jgi:hypothetical protein
MPQFLAILRADPASYDSLSPEAFAALATRFDAWAAPLIAQRRFLAGRKLTTDRARTVVRAGERVQVKDGPFGETKEMVGGYHLIEADDYDHAVALLGTHPNLDFALGSIEIRALDG